MRWVGDRIIGTRAVAGGRSITRAALVGTAATVATTILLAGCVKTTRIDDATTPETLAKSRKAVALMRIGAASTACVNVIARLGQRSGEGFRIVRSVTVADVKTLSDIAVVEVELDPGEYPVVGYSCVQRRGQTEIGSSDGHGLQKNSYARFTLAAGEVVNVGYLHFNAAHVNYSLFGRPVRTMVSVTDWPFAEIERFKTLRPKVYAQMTTRLMVVTNGPDRELTADNCAALKSMQAEGKVAAVPAACK